MEKSEPTLVPQWYRTGGVSSSNSNSNHRYSPSTTSDDQGIGLYSQNRLTPSTSGCDSQYPILADTTSNPSYHRTRSFNGSMGYGGQKRSRAYNNFNKGYHERGRGKIIGFYGKNYSNGLDNGYNDYIDDFPACKIEKDPSAWSQSKAVGRRIELQSKRGGNDLNNGITSPKNLIGGINKSSFERDFPSLCVEEKLQPSAIGRSPPTTLTTVSHSLPLGTSVAIGGKGWTSALAEVPPIIGSNGAVVSSVQQSTLSTSSPVAPCLNTGLNMAETVAKALSSTRLSPQLSDDTEMLAELAKRKLKTLIPVTPTTPKSSVSQVNSSDRLMTKVTKTGNMSMPTKFMSQTQQANYPNRGTTRLDVPRAQQIGNFQVLHRERNSSTSANKVPGPTVTNKGATAVSCSATSCHPKPKHDGIHGYTAEKRLSAQDRMSFFNTIRNGSSSNNSHHQHSVANCPTTEKEGEQNFFASNDSVCPVKEPPELDSHSVSPMMNGTGINANHDVLVDTKKILLVDEGEESDAPCSDVPDEEEIEFLRSLGWKEGSGEEALTPEEIDAFVRESGHLLNSVKMSCCHHN